MCSINKLTWLFLHFTNNLLVSAGFILAPCSFGAIVVLYLACVCRLFCSFHFLSVSCFPSSSYFPLSLIFSRTYYISVWLCCIMLLMKWRMVVDSLCGRKRRVPCSFWFLLLFAAGGLVLFIHQQDLSEMAQQQGPGQSLLVVQKKKTKLNQYGLHT